MFPQPQHPSHSAVLPNSAPPASAFASPFPTQYAYTIVYTNDVDASLRFYHQAFGLQGRYEDKKHMWGELNTGQTTLAFTPLEQRETALTGGAELHQINQPPHNVALGFLTQDPDGLFKRAVDAGAIPVAGVEYKKWGQRVAYVRDFNGVLIQIASTIENPPILDVMQ
eukprot:jgi/Chlat1/74/Chrsp1S08774